MMKIRTRRAPASTARGAVSHQEIATVRYIRHQTSAYGPSELMICHTALDGDGCWNLWTISFQDPGPDPGRGSFLLSFITGLAVGASRGFGGRPVCVYFVWMQFAPGLRPFTAAPGRASQFNNFGHLEFHFVLDDFPQGNIRQPEIGGVGH